jgi:hypothetical protein
MPRRLCLVSTETTDSGIYINPERRRRRADPQRGDACRSCTLVETAGDPAIGFTPTDIALPSHLRPGDRLPAGARPGPDGRAAHDGVCVPREPT